MSDRLSPLMLGLFDNERAHGGGGVGGEGEGRAGGGVGFVCLLT